MHEQLERNKQTVTAFYDLMFNQCRLPKRWSATHERSISSITRRWLMDGQEAMKASFTKMAKDYPGKRVHFKRVIAEGHYVVLHGYQQWPGDTD